MITSSSNSGKASWMLYDLKSDLGEEKNLAESMPEKVKELEKALSTRLENLHAKLPRPNPV